MLPDPLHPAAVHFPIVLALLLPVFAAVLFWKARGAEKPRRPWAWVVGYAVLTLVSAQVAARSGENEEDRVENAVAEEAIHGHEEKAEALTALAVVSLLVAGVGLAPGKIGTAGRALTLVAGVALAAQSVSVGKSGGELVYVHGAAAAYTDAVAAEPAPGSGYYRAERDDGDADDDD